MISYTDSEVRTFHPLCEKALTQAIAALGCLLYTSFCFSCRVGIDIHCGTDIRVS